jgi:phage baseplate assembly protein W
MADISLPWGGDVDVDETGDILIADGPTEIAQRVIRRILTNPAIRLLNGQISSDCDYIFAPTYGGGVRVFVDAPMSTSILNTIKSMVSDQLSREDAVDVTIDPTVALTTMTNGIRLNISFATPNGQVVLLPEMEIVR